MANEISVSQATEHRQSQARVKTAEASSAMKNASAPYRPDIVTEVVSKGQSKTKLKGLKTSINGTGNTHVPGRGDMSKTLNRQEKNPAVVVSISASSPKDAGKTDNLSTPTNSSSDNGAGKTPAAAGKEFHKEPVEEKPIYPEQKDQEQKAADRKERVENLIATGDRVDLTPVAGDPKATIEKMNRIRRTSLIDVENTPDDIIVTLHAITEATKAYREILAEKTAGHEERGLKGEEQEEKEKEEENTNTPAKAEKEDIPIHYLPSPGRYEIPTMANGGSIHTLRFSEPEKNVFNTSPFDPTHPLAKPESMNTVQQRNFARAFTPSSEETEPIFEIYT